MYNHGTSNNVCLCKILIISHDLISHAALSIIGSNGVEKWQPVGNSIEVDMNGVQMILAIVMRECDELFRRTISDSPVGALGLR